MLNLIFTPPVLLAFIISCFLVGLSLIKYLRGASLVRKVDAIYAILGFVYVVILLAHGWRLDPILIFAQCLLFGMSALMLIDNLRLRKLLLNTSEENVKKSYGILQLLQIKENIILEQLLLLEEAEEKLKSLLSLLEEDGKTEK